MDEDNKIKEAISFILWVLAFSLLVFLVSHGGEMANAIMDKFFR